MSILALFCDVDDFGQMYVAEWEHHLLTLGKRPRHHAEEMFPSESMTILIHFRQSCYCTFKHYCLKYVQVALRQEFPHMLRYTRMVEVMANYLVPLAVCKNPRIASHRVFAGLAQRGKRRLAGFSASGSIW